MKKLFALLLVLFLTIGLLASCGADDSTPSDSDYTYTEFTAADKLLFRSVILEEIPFLPTNDYVVKQTEDGILLKTIGNTADDLVAYLDALTGYTLSRSYSDANGNNHMVYTKGDISLDVHSYTEGTITAIEILASKGATGGNGGNQGGSTGGGTTGSSYAYNDFTSAEKSLFTQYIGAVIPFLPNNEYYIEGYTDVSDYQHGMHFYTFGNVQADLTAYIAKLENAGFELFETSTDEYGDTWYCYFDNDLVIDVSFYTYEGDDVFDLYVYSMTLSEDPNEDDSSDDTGSGSGNQGGSTAPATGVVAGNGYIISATNGLGTIYFKGSVTSSRFDASTNIADAVTVYVEAANGGYYLYFMNGSTKTYIVINDNSQGAALSTSASSASIFEWNATYNTLVVAKDDNNRGFGVNPSNSYSNFNCYDINNGSTYNWGQYILADGNGNAGGSNQGGTTGGGTTGGSTNHTYNDFSSSDKALFTQYIGAVIPFLPNDEYYIAGYNEETDYENGMNFYTFGNTQAEFNAYLTKLENAGFEFIETSEDEFGDTWYYYLSDDLVIDVAFYEYDGDYIVDLYVYSLTLSEDNSGSGGGSTISPEDIITNEDAGLPADDGDGIYNVDFTEADKVKDVTDQGNYLDGCPTTGSPAVLVIPVQFSDITAASKGFDLETLKNAFEKNGVTDYFSVYDYYYISSYGQLTLDITVLDFWFTPTKTSDYYAEQTMEYYGENITCGDQIILNEALKYLDSLGYDLSKYDSDNNGVIDAVVMINTLDIDSDKDLNWAYRYWNMHTDANDNYYTYDGVFANDYVWASFKFLYEEDGNYTNTNGVNTYTYIHEFAHILGADDYYDTAYVDHPMGGYDMMDMLMGDHNAFTKFNYGWITDSKLVVTNGSITVNLEAFYKNGDTIILANDWDETLGAYQEYYIIVYYTNDGLNTGAGGIFNEEGIVVYHINASLYKEEWNGDIYYGIYNTNTDPSDEYGTEDNLIEYVQNGSDYVYGVGDSLSSNVKDDSGEALGYTFTVNSLNGETASLTISKL